MAGFSKKLLIDWGRKIYKNLKEDETSFEKTCNDLKIPESIGKAALDVYAKENNLCWKTK